MKKVEILQLEDGCPKIQNVFEDPFYVKVTSYKKSDKNDYITINIDDVDDGVAIICDEPVSIEIKASNHFYIKKIGE